MARFTGMAEERSKSHDPPQAPHRNRQARAFGMGEAVGKEGGRADFAELAQAGYCYWEGMIPLD